MIDYIKMQSKSISMDQMTTPPASVPSWWSKENGIVTFTSGISAYVLPTGGTVGTIRAKLRNDSFFIDYPIAENDMLTPLPHIEKIDVSNSNVGLTALFFGESN